MKPSAKAIEMAANELRARLSQTNTATQFGFVGQLAALRQLRPQIGLKQL